MEVMKQLRQRAVRDLLEQRVIRTQQELAAAGDGNGQPPALASEDLRVSRWPDHRLAESGPPAPRA